VTKEPGSRVLRVPVGFIFISVGVLVVLLTASYWVGFLRGEAVVHAAWNIDRADALAADRQMRTVLEVDEPGGATRKETQPAPVDTARALVEVPVQASSPVPDPTPAPAPAPVVPVESTQVPALAASSGYARVEGINYYIIDHPSRQKVVELVVFCRKHGLDAHQTVSASGSPKVYVTPGYSAGQSAQDEIIELRERIREVGILWEREDPGRNSDFSTRYAEKYRPSPSSS
jgi:hypothetical protein